MKGIYYKEGIYVLVDNDKENVLCVYHYNLKDKVALIGGRVSISSSSIDIDKAYLFVDGINIIELVNQKWSNGITTRKIEEDLYLTTITSHLNAIEANGVDAFILNYKESINFLYGELKDINLKTEMQLSSEKDDSTIKKIITELDKIRDMMFSVLAILFSLHTFMIAGLENEKVISVCQSIMDSLS